MGSQNFLLQIVGRVQANEQRREAEAVDEAHYPVDIVIFFDDLADDKVIQRGNARAERDHQGAHLLGHVDSLLWNGKKRKRWMDG